MRSVLALVGLFALSNAAPIQDLITNLPGLDFNINYKQYSGYLNITSGQHLQLKLY